MKQSISVFYHPFKKAIYLFVFLLLLFDTSFAGYVPSPSLIIVTGRVVDENGQALQGVTVSNAKTRKSTLSSEDGTFSLKSENGDILIFSIVGYANKSIIVQAAVPVISVTMTRKLLELNPVVVTALGIKRETRSLGYSVGEVNGDDLKKAREINVINSLAGKVAGLVINSTAGGPAGSSRVIIRGNTEITGNNQPLYVIDGIPIDNSNYGQAGNDKYAAGVDMGDAISAINPDDIESISVLKGPSASALYGSRAAHGVILITTKKGGTRKSLGIEVNSTASIEKILTRFDGYQNEYGQGFGGSIPRDYNQARVTLFNNFGARLDPDLMIPGFDGKPNSYGLVKDNIGNFFRTGNTLTNTISLASSNDNTSFRLSFSDLRNNDVVPNSGIKRNTVNLRGTSKFGKNFTVDAKVMYLKETVNNRPALADDPANIGGNFLGLANNVDQQVFENGYKDVNGSYVDWGGGQYRLNPYWVINEMSNTTKKDRIIAALQANYTINNWASLQGRVSTDFTYLSFTKFSPRTTPGALLGRIEGINRKYETTEADALLSFHKQITGGLNGSIKFGTSISRQNHPGTTTQGSDMVVTDVISFNSFKDKIITEELYRKQINSVYALLNMGYKNILYLDGTIRRDASSTLPESNNVYAYPSVSGSFIFTDAFHIDSKLLSFGKLRMSAAEVGNDTDPYQLNLYYALSERPFGSQSVGGIVTKVLPNTTLKPTRTRSFEVGTELRFLNNKISLDATYYTQNSRDQINYVPAPFSSGFKQQIINAGVISNKGIEVLLTATPVATKSFKWDASINFAHNKNTVNSLADGVPYLVLSEARWLGVSVVAKPGAPYGAILGYDYQKDGAGNTILDSANLTPLASADRTVLGKGTWDWTGGISNTVSYKNFILNVALDIKTGADLFSMTNLYSLSRGSDVSTLEGRQEWIRSEEERLASGKTADEWAASGSVHGYIPKGVYQSGTDGSGKPVFKQNTRPVDPSVYWPKFFSDDKGIVTPFIYDASYIKMRELTLGYSIPAAILSRIKIAGATLTLVSRNPFIISKKVPNVDPDSNYNNGNGQGLEYGSLPSRKSWGMNLNLRF